VIEAPQVTSHLRMEDVDTDKGNRSCAHKARELFALLAKRTHRIKNDRLLKEMMLISAQSAASQTLFGKTKPTHANERSQ